MQYAFGAGQLWGKANTPDATPVQFGAVQGVTLDISYQDRALYGQKIFPIHLARGQAKLTGTAQFAGINADLFSLIIGGNAPAVGTVRTAIDEEHVVANLALTVTNAANFVRDLGVVRASNRDVYERVVSGPNGRQYTCNEVAGTYGFDTEAENRALLVSYNWTDTTGKQVALTNVDQAAAPSFQMVLSETFDNRPMTIVLNACVATRLTMQRRLEDWVIPNLSFIAMADANGVIGTISLDESDAIFWIVSATYPLIWTEQFAANATVNKGRYDFPVPETFNVSASFANGTLQNILRGYSNGVPEQFNVSASFANGTLQNILRNYSNGVAEQFNVSASFANGTLTDVLRTYTNGLPEQFNVSASFFGGTLS